MTQPQHGPPSDRININLPAVIGVVFVFLIGIVVWVITSGGSDESDAGSDATATSSADADNVAGGGSTQPSFPPGSTTPAPMPDLTQVTTTTASTVAPSSTAPPPPTTAPGAVEGAVLGDLAISGFPLQAPPCNGAYITLLGSAVGDQASAGGIANFLNTYPGSNYLRTDQTCPSLTQSIDGEPIYVVYLGPFAAQSDACAARAEGPEGAYVRLLSNDVGPDHGVSCAALDPPAADE